MDRLQPFEKLADDEYYTGGGGWRDEDSGDDMSSDDELQAELRKMAGIPAKCDKKRGDPPSEFEDDMEDQLDRSICDYADLHMGTKASTPKQLAVEDVRMTEETPETSGSKTGDDDNPIRKLVDKAKETTAEEEKEVEFYDPDEDDNNEKWVEERSKKTKGSSKSKGKIDNDSDAVLSCPGCMNLLTRDCQRHELYKDQYRAMFVENCAVDTEEKLTIEKTGKEMRRQRQKQKKTGFIQSIATSKDLFYPVRCQICKTKVAVMDNDEVYHFFNVLTGYA